eukprot:6464503-Heterocapsa_arctica.AAC.1
MDLFREIQTQSSLDHPNVAKLQAVYESQEHTHLVVESLEGGEVFKHLMEEGVLPEYDAIRVIEQLLRAVGFVHDQGLVHRDIKLENMIYTSTDRDSVKLIDF